MMKHVLSIAGTDTSGGAGAAADCKTFCAHGCFALNVITAVVSQNTQGVRGYMDVTPELIASQIDAVFEDIDVDAVKIGMVSVPETIRVIADKLKQYQPPYVVIDPVMVATSGHRLLVPGSRTDTEGSPPSLGRCPDAELAGSGSADREIH